MFIKKLTKKDTKKCLLLYLQTKLALWYLKKQNTRILFRNQKNAPDFQDNRDKQHELAFVITHFIYNILRSKAERKI
jgi:hypothetical protein